MVINSNVFSTHYGYKVTHPERPNQDILIVGSLHMIPLSSLPSALVREMKSKDILITETVMSPTWSEETLMKSVLDYLSDKMEHYNENIISEFPVKIVDDYWVPFLPRYMSMTGMPLKSSELQILNTFFKYLKNNLNSKLGGKTISHINPMIIPPLIENMARKKGFSLGMDMMIARHFQNSNKPNFTLSENKQSDVLYEIPESLIPWAPDHKEFLNLLTTSILGYIREFHIMENISAQQLLNYLTNKSLKLKSHISNYIKKGINVQERDITGISSVEREMTRIGRENNILWSKKLMDYLNQNTNKSFVVVVGMFHLLNQEGSMKRILESEGYIFEPSPSN